MARHYVEMLRVPESRVDSGSGRVPGPDPKFSFSRVDSGYPESNPNLFFNFGSSPVLIFLLLIFHLLWPSSVRLINFRLPLQHKLN
jgi:hypothetical protein